MRENPLHVCRSMGADSNHNPAAAITRHESELAQLSFEVPAQVNSLPPCILIRAPDSVALDSHSSSPWSGPRIRYHQSHVDEKVTFPAAAPACDARAPSN